MAALFATRTGSKTKIKSGFPVLHSHAIRYEWLTFNPIEEADGTKRIRLRTPR
jgi:hypothetical protein